MALLIDTNVISELVRGRKAQPKILEWAHTVREVPGISVITISEVASGFALVPNQKKQQLIKQYLSNCNILKINREIAEHAGTLHGQFKRAGEERTLEDMFIAATATFHGLTLVTRNERDFVGCGIAVLNPYL